MTTTEKLARLDRKLADARAQERLLRAEQQAAQLAVREAQAALTEHYERSDDEPPQQVARRHDQARAKAAHDWQVRGAGLRRRVAQLESERDAFVRKHVAELAAEVEPRAVAAQERLEAALGELVAAHADWHTVSAAFSQLLRPVPGVDGRDVPAVGVACERAVHEARHALDAGVPAPLPRSLFQPDDDPTIRSAA